MVTKTLRARHAGRHAQRQDRPAQRQGQTAGFSFIEMVLVLLVLGILFAIAVPRYQAQILKAKEAVLEHNLATLRERLDQYRADHDEFPANLADLVVSGYLRQIPEDPMTQSILWEEVRDGYDPMFPEAPAGVSDVRSRSEEVGSNGRPYREW